MSGETKNDVNNKTPATLEAFQKAFLDVVQPLLDDMKKMGPEEITYLGMDTPVTNAQLIEHLENMTDIGLMFGTTWIKSQRRSVQYYERKAAKADKEKTPTGPQN